MAYLLKLGPVQLSGATTNVYLRITETGDVSQPVFGSDDVVGVRELLGNDSPSSMKADPSLNSAAEAIGIAVEPASLAALRSASAIAVFMAWGQRGLSS